MKLLRKLVILVQAGLRAGRRPMAQPYRPELHYMRGPGPRSLAKAASRLERTPRDRPTR